ncbi:unnamed protein product, partial [Durusdinium trenchii]
MVEFARWVDAFCPPNNQLHYATNYSDASHLRPYMCAWRADTGCSGFFEPDLALMLMELILSEGFLSDPDLPGCEKVAATQIPQEYLDAEYVALPKGEAYVNRWMAEHCCLVQVDETLQGAVAGFLTFKEQFRGRPGGELLLLRCRVCRYAVVSFDATIWPANASQVSNATSVLSQLLAMSSTHMGWVLYPILQSQTTQQAMVKRRHLLDLALLKGQVSLGNSVQVLYTKPTSTAKDSRSLAQPALATFHQTYNDPAWASSEAVKQGKVGPCPLLKIADFQGYDDTSKPGASARAEQKGIECADAMIDGLLDGMQLTDSDRVFWIDLVPNEFAEFSRACAERNWKNARKVLYVGFLNAKQVARATRSLRDYVYKGWDESSAAPAKTRPPDEQESKPPPELQILAFEGGRAVWPRPLLSRFDPGTEEHSMMAAKKAEFDAAFPQSAAETRNPAPGRTSGQPQRAGGLCDFSIDGGLEPLDVQREISLAAVTDADFEAERNGRLGMSESKAGKPAVLIASNLNIWLGNGADEDMTFKCQELFGFGVGAFEEKVASDPNAESNVLPFCLRTDLDLVAYNMEVYPLCSYLRFLAIEKGFGEVQATGEDPVPVTFRYEIHPKESKVTHVFRPRSEQSTQGTTIFRPQSLGQ